MEPLTNEQQGENLQFETGKLLTGVSFEDYRNAPGINSHGLIDLLRSPKHYYEFRYNRVEETNSEAREFGKLFHYAILESQMFAERYVMMPKFDKRTKDGKVRSEEWLTKLKPGAIVVPEQWCDQLLQLCDKMVKHPISRGLLTEGAREATLFWNDEETGELCKARPDFVSKDGYIVDLKTTTDARYQQFSKDILKFSYHIQAAHYTEGARVTKTARSDSFIFIVVEKKAPYEIAVYPAGNSVLGVGSQWRSKAIRLYSKCRKSGQWPGYDYQARTIELPIWAEAAPLDDDDVV